MRACCVLGKVRGYLVVVPGAHTSGHPSRPEWEWQSQSQRQNRQNGQNGGRSVQVGATRGTYRLSTTPDLEFHLTFESSLTFPLTTPDLRPAPITTWADLDEPSDCCYEFRSICPDASPRDAAASCGAPGSMVAKEFLDSDRVNFLVWRFVMSPPGPGWLPPNPQRLPCITRHRLSVELALIKPSFTQLQISARRQ